MSRPVPQPPSRSTTAEIEDKRQPKRSPKLGAVNNDDAVKFRKLAEESQQVLMSKRKLDTGDENDKTLDDTTTSSTNNNSKEVEEDADSGNVNTILTSQRYNRPKHDAVGGDTTEASDPHRLTSAQPLVVGAVATTATTATVIPKPPPIGSNTTKPGSSRRIVTDSSPKHANNISDGETEQKEKSTNQQPKPPRKPSVLSRVIKAIPHRFSHKSTPLPKLDNDKKDHITTSQTESESLPQNKNVTIGECVPLDETRQSVIHASCFCKDIEYELLEFPEDIQHCYCSMCRKMHGAPVASWCPMLEKNIRWTKGLHALKSFQSSEHGCRYFCGRCSANVALKYDFQSGTLWVTPALFDIEYATTTSEPWFESCRILHIFCGSRAKWYPLPDDGQPQLDDSNIFIDDNTVQNDPDHSKINLEKPPDHISLQTSHIPAKPPPKNI